MKARLLILVLLFAGCAPSGRLTFPYRKLTPSPAPQWFDVNRNGKPDFAITFAGDRMDALCYDDNEDGTPDRVYHLSDYDNDSVNHLIVLLDSIPFQSVADLYSAGEFRWCDPPAKVIAPFPSLTEVCYTELLHAAPMPGMIDQYYSRKTNALHNGLFSRAVGGYQHPWERYVHYRSDFAEEGFAYLDPKDWYQAELERARKTLDKSPDRVTLVYITTASGMVCKYGQEGVDEVMNGAARLCLQLLYERRGAIKITLMADHGHNLVASKYIDVTKLLKTGGFRVTGSLKSPEDVVLETNGLVTYAAVRTTQPKRVADRLLTHEGIDFAMYMEADRVILRDPEGAAAIESVEGKIRYQPITRDVLSYGGERTLSRQEWFTTTADDQYPHAPVRLWEAFHERVIDPPDVMFTTRDGFHVGLPAWENFIDMKSTHGSFNQINTATFVLSMTGRTKGTMLTRDVMRTIEPSWQPRVVKK